MKKLDCGQPMNRIYKSHIREERMKIDGEKEGRNTI
jgi:hypothetical protein